VLPINKDILRLSLPSILANITIPLVGIVDTAIVGHISDAAAIGGIAIGTMLFDLLYWNFGFLRVGTSGLTAQAYGKGEGVNTGERVNAECRKILTRSLTIALIAAFLIWAIQALFVKAVLAVVPCSIEAASVAKRYFFIRIWAAPATLMLFTCKGWFIGMQDTKSPMAVDILVNVMNIAASYFLAIRASMGVEGVAFGTLIAQYSGLLLTVLILAFKYKIIHIGLIEMIMSLRGAELKRMMALNGNLIVRSLCFLVVYVGYTSLASMYGDTELAVSSILMKLFMFFSFFVDGFAYAGEALVGKTIGMSRADALNDEMSATKSLNDVVRSLFTWSMGVGVLFTLIYGIWGKTFIAAMTDDATVLVAAERYIVWLAAMPLVSALAFMWDGIFVGATAGKQIRNAMIWAAVGFVIAYAATFRWIGIQALYVAYFVHLIARVVYLSVQWKEMEIDYER